MFLLMTSISKVWQGIRSGVRFKNRERFVARYGLLARIMMKMNSGKTYFIIPITDLVLDEGYKDVAAFVAKVGNTFNIRVAEYSEVGDGKKVRAKVVH